MTHAEAPGGPDYGHLVRDGERAVVRFERHLPHPPTKVWRALTEPEHLAGWHTSLDRLACELSGAKAPSGSGSGSGSGERWREVNEVYVARFGAQASTIGPPEEWERAHRAQGDRR
jgi:hypothetical protein